MVNRAVLDNLHIKPLGITQLFPAQHETAHADIDQQRRTRTPLRNAFALSWIMEMVPRRGLEPPRGITPLAPEASASANFATSA